MCGRIPERDCASEYRFARIVLCCLVAVLPQSWPRIDRRRCFAVVLNAPVTNVEGCDRGAGAIIGTVSTASSSRTKYAVLMLTCVDMPSPPVNTGDSHRSRCARRCCAAIVAEGRTGYDLVPSGMVGSAGNWLSLDLKMSGGCGGSVTMMRSHMMSPNVCRRGLSVPVSGAACHVAAALPSES